MEKDNARTCTLNMRVTPKEREMIRALADEYHMSQTMLIVHLVRKEYERRHGVS